MPVKEQSHKAQLTFVAIATTAVMGWKATLKAEMD